MSESELVNGIFCPVCKCFPCQCDPRRLACEHPLVCISAEYQLDTDEPTRTCAWCASLDEERRAEQARCVTVAHMTPIEKPSETDIEELHFFTAGPPVDEGEAWAYYHAEAIAQAIDYSCKEARNYRATIKEETDNE